MNDETPWEDIGGKLVRPAGWERQSTLPSATSPAAASLHRAGLVPAEPADFIAILTPCLQLVAPVGMTEEDRDTWFEAATVALADVPADLLRRGAQHAMHHADHPAKILPCIMREIGEALDRRRRPAGSRIMEGASNAGGKALPAPGGERATAGELDAICRRYRVGRYASEQSVRPRRREMAETPQPPRASGRAPTREDYIRMGVDPAVLDRIAAEREAAA